MKVEYYKEYSNCLNRDMEYKVYGHAGIPLLVFPAQDGRFFDFENFGMINVIADKIDAGLVQVFCLDSIDGECWSDEGGDNNHRTYMMEQWYYYVMDELVSRIFEINGTGQKIYTTGCSMGASHACNFMFRRPDVFKGCICLSGYYDSDLFFGDYHDERLYNNSPIQYLQGMSYDHPYVEMYRHCDIILCCGQGAWEDEMIYSTRRMQELLEYKDIPAWIDFWGYDVNHDWDWWQVQLPYFLNHIL